jgi:hypothetical protein
MALLEGFVEWDPVCDGGVILVLRDAPRHLAHASDPQEMKKRRAQELLFDACVQSGDHPPLNSSSPPSCQTEGLHQDILRPRRSGELETSVSDVPH